MIACICCRMDDCDEHYPDDKPASAIIALLVLAEKDPLDNLCDEHRVALAEAVKFMEKEPS